MKTKKVSYHDLANAGASVISLAKNPKNLSPAIDAIVSRVKSLRAEHPSKRIVMIFGEEHSTPAHVILPMGVLSRLYKTHANDIAASLELPHNYAHTIIEDLSEAGKDVTSLKESLETDESGQSHVEVVLNYSRTVRAPYSNHTFGVFCQGKKLSVCFADVATDEDSELIDLEAESQDLCGESILKKLGIDDPASIQISMESKFGVALRNMGMHERTLAHTIINNKPIVALRTGAGHVFGDKIYPPVASLSSLFHQSGEGVICIPVMPMGGGAMRLSDVTPDSIPLFKNGFVITDVFERRFNANDGTKEISHLENILRESGFFTKTHPA